MVIEQVTPLLDCGRYPIKRPVGSVIDVGAAIFKDGHDQIAARVVCRAPGAGRRALVGMAIRALFGRTTPGELKLLEAEELWVQTRRNRRLKVANDGEVLTMTSPLHYRIRPKALRRSQKLL